MGSKQPNGRQIRPRNELCPGPKGYAKLREFLRLSNNKPIGPLATGWNLLSASLLYTPYQADLLTSVVAPQRLSSSSPLQI